MDEVLYHYFVTFRRANGNEGQVGISVPAAIESMLDIEAVCDKIESDNPEAGSVILTNFPSLMKIEGIDSTY